MILLNFTAEEKNRLSREHEKLIYYVANSFTSKFVSYEEFFELASIGFVKALNNYNPEDDRGAKFSTYATTCMRNEVLHFLRKNNKHYERIQLSGDVKYTNDDGSTFTIEDTLSSEMNGEQNLEDFIEFKEDLAIIIKAINTLPEREKFIIKNRYGVNGGDVLTQQEIGDILGMTQANVSKLESTILEKLKTELEEKISIEGDGFYVDYAPEKKIEEGDKHEQVKH